jgi:predicted AAA+ superfamily ATPase
MSDLAPLLQRLDALIERVERAFPPGQPTTDWSHHAYRWRPGQWAGFLQPISRPHRVEASDLLCMDRQKGEILRNTAQFVAGRPANNVLLWGSRGTGKSTLVKAAFNAYRQEALRLVEVDKSHLVELPDIVDHLADRPERFVVFCDDLSFEADESGYKSLKAVLEGSATEPPENVLVYATSNRRHLMPEFQRENREARMVDGELHQGEAVEEKISLSERFGLWLSFHPFNQEQYLAICDHWLRKLGAPGTDKPAIREAALQWALYRGSRSGRVARQFALDRAGRA